MHAYRITFEKRVSQEELERFVCQLNIMLATCNIRCERQEESIIVVVAEPKESISCQTSECLLDVRWDSAMWAWERATRPSWDLVVDSKLQEISETDADDDTNVVDERYREKALTLEW